MRTVDRAAVDHDPRAEARPAGEVGEAAGAAIGAPARLGQRARGGVVVDGDRQVKVGSQPRADRKTVQPGQMRRAQHDAGARVHRSADRHSNRQRVVRDRAQRCDDRGVECVAVSRLRGPCATLENRAVRRSEHDARRRPADVDAREQAVHSTITSASGSLACSRATYAAARGSRAGETALNGNGD